MSVLDVRQKWTDALTSGKYVQGKDSLRTGNTFCCLGVLCDLYAEENPDTSWDDEDMFVYAEDARVNDLAPFSVANWAGITQAQMSSLAEANDGGESFEHIAASIADMPISVPIA
tara:strand:- start:191 stop:535 length:345 start_codon:yes stop_codon:yes gene_type:complete